MANHYPKEKLVDIKSNDAIDIERVIAIYILFVHANANQTELYNQKCFSCLSMACEMKGCVFVP